MAELCASCANYYENDDCCECDGTDSNHPYYEPKKKPTNADRIRAKDTERLAEFLNRVETDGRCGNLRGKNGWLDWIRSPAEVKE